MRLISLINTENWLIMNLILSIRNKQDQNIFAEC